MHDQLSALRHEQAQLLAKWERIATPLQWEVKAFNVEELQGAAAAVRQDAAKALAQFDAAVAQLESVTRLTAAAARLRAQPDRRGRFPECEF